MSGVRGARHELEDSDVTASLWRIAHVVARRGDGIRCSGMKYGMRGTPCWEHNCTWRSWYDLLRMRTVVQHGDNEEALLFIDDVVTVKTPDRTVLLREWSERLHSWRIRASKRMQATKRTFERLCGSSNGPSVWSTYTSAGRMHGTRRPICGRQTSSNESTTSTRAPPQPAPEPAQVPPPAPVEAAGVQGSSLPPSPAAGPGKGDTGPFPPPFPQPHRSDT